VPVPAFFVFSFAEARLDRKRCALGVVLVRDRTSKQSHQPVPQLLGDVAADLRHSCRSGIEIGAN
jgi:hypothetical protein